MHPRQQQNMDSLLHLYTKNDQILKKNEYELNILNIFVEPYTRRYGNIM